MRRKSWFILGLFLVLFSVSCKKMQADTSNLYIPTPSDVIVTATLDELNQGRSLYINNCARCHQLYSPDRYSASQRSSIVASMAYNTSLSTTEVNLVKKYVSKGN